MVAMPTITSGSEYILYNKTLLDEQGIKVPTTYDELVAANKELKAKGLMPLALGARMAGTSTISSCGCPTSTAKVTCTRPPKARPSSPMRPSSRP